MPPPPDRPAPAEEWLTADEAAAVIGISANAVRALLRRGRLRPARRRHAPGEKGPPRWLVAAGAALAYRSPSEGYAWPARPGAPAGHVTVRSFSEASGIPHATLCRRMRDGAVASVTVGRRRFIPAAELERVAGPADRDREGQSAGP